jgi:hypothetical protein
MSFFTNQLPGNYYGSARGYSAWQIADRGHADPQAGTFYETDIAADRNQQMIGILAELDKPETKLEWTLCTRPCTYGSSAREVFCSLRRDTDYQKAAVAGVIAKEDGSGKVPGSNQNRCKKH